MSPKNLPEAIGRYDIIDRIGYGGMGIVYRGRDSLIGRAVAIKLLRVSDDDLRNRFLQEVRAAGNLQHRNIVTIYDYGEHDGQPFIVMQLVEGVTLSEQIRSGVQLSLPRKLELIEELASGLDYAHSRGIVHRDVKPANAMIDRDGVLKILDFGIARVSDSSLTQIGAMMGTPNYMSPEQVEGRPVDRRSDIFAVGLVAYELLSYRQAFSGETVHLVLNAIVKGTPAALHDVCPGLDPTLEVIISKAIEKDPSDRYQTLAEMAEEIAIVAARSGNSGTDTLDSSDTIVLTPPPTPRRTARPATERDQLSKRRAERIEGDLQAARRAFDAGDFAAAVEACEQATLIDPDEPRVLDFLEKAKKALHRHQTREWLKQAVEQLDQQDADQAGALVDRVLELDPASGEALSLRKAIDELRMRQQQELRKQQAILSALARSRESLVEGNPESAVLAASEVLIYDPAHQEAQLLKREALQAIERQRHQQERDRAAQTAVDRNQREFAAGRHHEAIEALERFAPPHNLVDAALADLRVELAEYERRTREEQERLSREAEQQRQLQRRWVSEQMALATGAVNERRFGEAITVLQLVERTSPETPELATLFAAARAGKAALEAEARRQKEIAEALTRATVEFSAGRLSQARDSLRKVLALAPEHLDARDRLAQVETAIESKRRQDALDRAAQDAVEAARRRFETGEHIAAIASLESFAPSHALTTRTRDELRARLAEMDRERREADRRKRIEDARAAVDRARHALWQGEFDDALRALDEAQAADPDNESVSLLRGRTLAGQEEAQQRREKERLEREAIAEQSRRQAEVLISILTRGEAALEAADFGSADRLVREALAVDATSAGAQALRARVVEGETRRREAAAREARQRRIDEQYGRAQAEAKAGQFTQALDRLQRLERIEGPVPGLEEHAAKVRAARSAAEAQARSEERQREQQQARDRKARTAAALERAKSTESALDAVAILEDALRLDPDHRGCRDLLAARQAEIVSAIGRLIDDGELDRALKALDETESLGIALPGLRILRERLRTAQATEMAQPMAVAEPLVDSQTVENVSPYTDPPLDVSPEVYPVPAPRSVNWARWGALAAGLLVLTGGALFLRTSTPKPESGSSTAPATALSTVVTTSILPTVVTTSIPATPLPRPVDVESIVAEARRLLAGQNLPDAARQIVAGWKIAPGNAGLERVLRDLLRTAAAGANAAKGAADRAGAGGRPEYREAMLHLVRAGRLTEPAQAVQAVDEYATAARLFDESAKSVPVLTTQTTALTTAPASVPVTILTVLPVTITAPPTILSSTPTTSVVSTTSVVPTTIDSATVNRLLSAYATAYGSLDVKAFQQAYPGLSDRVKQRIEQLRKSYSACGITIEHVTLTATSPTDATVQGDTVEVCKSRIGKDPPALRSPQQFRFVKRSGSWTLDKVFVEQ